MNLRGLWKNSPIAVFAILMVGVSNASFGTLAAVYASRIGFSIDQIALFASVPILAGAASQIPVGITSDRYDRRVVFDCDRRNRPCRGCFVLVLRRQLSRQSSSLFQRFSGQQCSPCTR